MPTFSERHVVFWVSCIIIFGGLLLVLPLRLLPSLLAKRPVLAPPISSTAYT